MMALGNNAHLFARPSRRQDLVWCFETALGCGPVRTVEHPAMPESMLVVDFPGGGHLSIEFVEDAPDDDRPRLGRGWSFGLTTRRPRCVWLWKRGCPRSSTRATRTT